MLALPVLYLLFGKGPQPESGPGRDDDRRDHEPGPEPEDNGHRRIVATREPESVGAGALEPLRRAR
jgi:hypothetical protein